jgi:hypothetical protein
MRDMIGALAPGRRAGMIHYVIPRCPPGARFVACIGVVCCFCNRGRFYTVFERGPNAFTETVEDLPS